MGGDKGIKPWLNNWIPKALTKPLKFFKTVTHKTPAFSSEMSTIMKQIFVMSKILGFFGY